MEFEDELRAPVPPPIRPTLCGSLPLSFGALPNCHADANGRMVFVLSVISVATPSFGLSCSPAWRETLHNPAPCLSCAVVSPGCFVVPSNFLHQNRIWV